MIAPPLYAVLDAEACVRGGRTPFEVADAFVEAGVTLIQVRGKTLGTRALLELASGVVRRAGARARVIVNDRADVAVLAGAAGVHVGQDDLSVADVRRVMGQDAVVGLSTHTIEQAVEALAQPVSYVAVGPIFGTRTKETGYAAVGLDLVSGVSTLARARGVPVVGIGGITLARAPAVMAAGATAVCVISDLLVGDPGSRARDFLALLGPGGPPPQGRPRVN